jgi:hypothetical protein
MVTLIVSVAVLVALDLAALRWGVDTRRGDGGDWDWGREWPHSGAGLSRWPGATTGKAK